MTMNKRWIPPVISQFRTSDSSSMRLARTFSATVKMYYVYVLCCGFTVTDLLEAICGLINANQITFKERLCEIDNENFTSDF